MKPEIEKIIEEKLSLSFTRSGGPGGQNVNKVNTKVTARLPLACLAECLDEAEFARLTLALKNRLTIQGELVIQVQENRSQWLNRAQALLKIKLLIAEALKKRKKRLHTRASVSSVERRLQSKKIRSLQKRCRRDSPFKDQ